jgi:hypothetical protein
LAVADRDLGASKTPGLHNDWGFNIAYNAALQIATAALAASGYQAERANHHYRVIDSLSLTLGTESGWAKWVGKSWRTFCRCGGFYCPRKSGLSLCR